MSSYIVLIDPSLKNNSGSISDNLGDCIISDAVLSILKELFPSTEIVRISPHIEFDTNEKKIINQSKLSFVGGTNILTSNVRHFPRLTPTKRKGFYLYPGFKNLVLLGAGWNIYERTPDWATIFFYKRILHSRFIHSLRDRYSERQLNKAFIKNTIFTGCPTTWDIDTSFKNQFNSAYPILLTLTDYNQDPVADSKLISAIFNLTSGKIFFFPQGSEDLAYFQSLAIVKENQSKFSVLKYHYKDFKNFIEVNAVNYIGTRLHAGIKCIERKLPSIIIGIDNRAMEMKKDINLPVISRNNLSFLEKWAQNIFDKEPIQLPLANIIKWKKQFESSLVF